MPQPATENMLTAAQVCDRLAVSPAWLGRHRSLFVWIRIPGRGKTGEEYRYTEASVTAYIQRGLARVSDAENPFRGRTVAEMTQLIKSRAIPLPACFNEKPQ